MQQPVKERIAKLREEIAQIREANRLYVQGGKKIPGAASDHERRLQRLQENTADSTTLTNEAVKTRFITASLYDYSGDNHPISVGPTVY